MTKELNFAQDLIDFIGKSPSAFHVVENVKEELVYNGFTELNFSERWNIKKEGKYFVTKNDSALIAFVVGKGDIEKEGFKLIGAHTDSPTFKIKPNPEIIEENTYLRLNTEVYGGPILNTWFDRPLSFIIGRKNNNKRERFILSKNLSYKYRRAFNDYTKFSYTYE